MDHVHNSFFVVAGSLFMLIGSLAPNIAVAQIVSPLVVVLFMLFGGFYVNVVRLNDVICTKCSCS